jgi:transcriptional regulator with XRE-family HTH domain
MNQLDLALEAGMSGRHLSCVETGKSQASREIVGRPANALGMPLREHNRYRVLVRALAVTNIGGADAPYIPDPRGVDWAAVMALTAHLGAFLSGANS